jgi:hypothetical protein
MYSLWKTSLYHAALAKAVPFLPASCSKAACMKLQYEQVSIMHHEQLPQESNPVQPLSRLNTPQQKLKNINS